MKLHSIFSSFLSALVAIAIASCSAPSVPDNATPTDSIAHIYPDYTQVTVPTNIAPLNFQVMEDATEAVARFTTPDGAQHVYGDGTKIIIGASDWADMLAKAKGDSIKVEVFAQSKGKWLAYRPFGIYVAEEPVDQYISYRLIQPSYVAYEDLTISQRDLTTFDQSDIYNNMSVSTEAGGQCINCHSYRNYKTDQMLFHMRSSKDTPNLAGTVIVNKGEVCKVNLKTEHTISAGVYPAWHPTENVIAFSTNNTGQSFHTKDINKIEVQDSKSDLILYDVDKNEVSIITDLEDELEVFPTWSPDGKKLYFCSAHFIHRMDSLEPATEMIKRYDEIEYDLYSCDFDPSTRQFSNAHKIYDASAIGKSATLPRVSPDGQYLLFAEGDFGCFHVWHHDADIKMLNLKTGELVPVDVLNSNRSESYPSWSSNGRWILLASRRDDGNYTRPYIAYFDKNGKAHKPFEVPQADPEFYTLFLRSFNRPEFMVEPVSTDPHEFTKLSDKAASPVNFAK